MGYWDRNEVSELVGETVTAIEVTADEIKMALADGRVAIFWHSQDCCESVYIEDINGSWDDLIDTPLLVAEERVSHEVPDNFPEDEYYGDSSTWTFYTFRTIKGSVDVRWYGTSNGYYSESVDFRIDTN